MKNILSTVSALRDGTVILEYLRRDMNLSATLVKKVKYGGVFINGENVHMRAVLRAGDTVEVRLPEESSENIMAYPMQLEVIYEDEWMIAVNKPRGMPTHPSRGNSLPTLAEGIMAYFGDDFVFRAVNRLDRDTGGIVLIAKDQISAARLSEIMKRGGFSKKYEAVVMGLPTEAHGVIDAPIARECEGNMRRVVRDDGKRAVTEYRVLREIDGERSLVEITLHTGRTHQIRVHMAHIGHPLFADFLYGEKVSGENYLLHAKELRFIHPFTNEEIVLESAARFGAVRNSPK